MSNAFEIPVGDEQEQQPQPRAKQKGHVVIVVNGGNVQDVIKQHCRGVRVTLLDFDNINRGDEPELPRPKKGERGPVAAVARQAWRAFDAWAREAEEASK